MLTEVLIDELGETVIYYQNHDDIQEILRKIKSTEQLRAT